MWRQRTRSPCREFYFDICSLILFLSLQLCFSLSLSLPSFFSPSVFFTSLIPRTFSFLPFSCFFPFNSLLPYLSVSGSFSLSLSIFHCGGFEASRWGTRQREMRVIKGGMRNWTGEGWVWLHAIWLPCGRPLVTVSCLSTTLHPWNTAGYTHTHTCMHAHSVSDIYLLLRCKSQT